MHHLGFIPCLDDLNMWINPMIRSEDEYNYDAYVLIYVDDVMVIRRGSDNVLRRIDNYFNINPSSIGDPHVYLGAKLKKNRLQNRV